MTRVLLLEDSADVLYILQLELQWMGYEVDPATEASAALASAMQTCPDIIVSDLGMPIIDGFEFIRRVRATPHLGSIPAIALTGTTNDRDVQQALACGFTAHLVKPVDAADLGRKIDQLTSRHLKRKAS